VRTVLVDGRQRGYILHVPPGYAPGHPISVVLNFHGGGDTAAKQMVRSQMNATADARLFLVAYPIGTGRPGGGTWNAGSCCGLAKAGGVDDVAFTQSVIRDLESRYSIDRRRVFATGISNGAMFAYRLACELSGEVAAVAPVAGSLGVATCDVRRPVSVLDFHGTSDEYAPFDGGYGKILSSGRFRSVRSTVSLFAREDGCRTTPRLAFHHGDATILSYRPCRGGAAVASCVVRGGGHTWPDGLNAPGLGPTSHDISANDAMWRFFSAHPIPASYPVAQ
jgi:polyhydroxybutyrate depolymerase